MYQSIQLGLVDRVSWTGIDPSLVAQVVPDLPQEAVTTVSLVALVVLLLLSGFFASSEIAIFSLGDARISTLVEEQKRGASTLSVLKSSPRRLLVTILVGNNIANIAMASITTGLLGAYLAPGESVIVSTFGVTAVVLLFGESAPKSYAVANSESWALRIAHPLRAVQYVMYPLVEVFDRLTRLVNRVLGGGGDFEAAYVTRSEIRELIEAGQREGVLTDEEHRMLQRLLRFRNRTAKETMVPRLDVAAVDADAGLAAAIEACLDSGYTQLPIYEDTLDTVVGVVHVKDLLAATRSESPPTLRAIAEEPYVVPESKDVDDLLAELRAERRNLAVVVDEFGTTAGIVTIEDIVEEIIGEVLSEHEGVPIRWVSESVALVRGELNVHAVNEALGTDLPEEGGYESVAGLVLDRAGRLVEEGESVTDDGTRLVVETTDNNRILEIRVELPGTVEGPVEASGEE